MPRDVERMMEMVTSDEFSDKVLDLSAVSASDVAASIQDHNIPDGTEAGWNALFGSGYVLVYGQAELEGRQGLPPQLIEERESGPR